MDQLHSTSTVTVEYYDPHDVYKLLEPGLAARLPLRGLHWQSHSGPLRSIEALHVELIRAASPPAPPPHPPDGPLREVESAPTQQHAPTHATVSSCESQQLPPPPAPGIQSAQRRHQIPGLCRTPYLKLLLVRCDDNESYKSSVRSEIREWIKTHATPSASSKKAGAQEKHDAFEWLILHVVIPNTVAATQPRRGSKSDASASEKSSSSSRWRSGSTPLMEKLRSDFNSSGKGAPDRIAQIRIGINDVPYDMLPRVVPALPSGYSESEQELEKAWTDLLSKLKSLILSSFDLRVTQYEEDLKEKDGQRNLPGWNFCTFFILKEGLSRGFENVGLVEDALVGYDELSVGLDSVLSAQAQTGPSETLGGAMLAYSEDVQTIVRKALAGGIRRHSGNGETDDAALNEDDQGDEMPIDSRKKPYRDMILANKVSVFDFRCYIFSRQLDLLLRLGNTSPSQRDVRTKLQAQQDSILQDSVFSPNDADPNVTENLSMLSELCRRCLDFIISISQVLRQDVMLSQGPSEGTLLAEAAENIVSSFAFSVAQQILAQTATKSLHIPPANQALGEGHRPQELVSEPSSVTLPVRSFSLPSQPSISSGRERPMAGPDSTTPALKFPKPGLEEVAALRAELYLLCRNILEALGRKRDWTCGWDAALLSKGGSADVDKMDEVSLDDRPADPPPPKGTKQESATAIGIKNPLLRAALNSSADFYRMYEILTEKALRHYTVANYEHAARACMADLAVLKVHQKEYKDAIPHFHRITPYFGESGWSSLELSMLAMYSGSLSQLQLNDEYVRVTVKLLKKACTAERERLENGAEAAGPGSDNITADMPSIRGHAKELLTLVKTDSNDVRVPLANFFARVQLGAAPEYHSGRDSCTMTVNLHSLLPTDMECEAAKLKITCLDGGGACRDIILEKQGRMVLSPGPNQIAVTCNSVVPGKYEVSHFSLVSGKLLLYHERGAHQTGPTSTDVFRRPEVTLYQRRGALEMRLKASKLTFLDKNNWLELEIKTGWNQLQRCEVRVRPATGGLRLLTTEAEVMESRLELAKRPESGAFFFGAMDEGTSVRLRFPYTVEQDVVEVSAKLEATYVDGSGESYYLAKWVTAPVSLALGVNVQDVFRHEALLSRFNVSTARPSPLRLYKSELLDSELFESSSGVPPSAPVTIFRKQPASLLYRVTRKLGKKSSRRADRTMYLRLHYSVLQDEVEEALRASVVKELARTRLEAYSELVAETVLGEAKKGLQEQDLDRAALLGKVSTAFLEGTPWRRRFQGLGLVPGSSDEAADGLSDFLDAWQQGHEAIKVPALRPEDWPSILIPVEIPSLPVVLTADLRLGIPGAAEASGATATVCANQVLAARLHLKWTRRWDTEARARSEQAYSYEVTAPADSWLLGGRRRGRLVVPAPAPSPGDAAAQPSETEMALTLVPLRPGWLPFPSVEVRELGPDGGPDPAQSCELDWRNLGETIRVTAETKALTVSLDASGPAGGPLLLQSERLPRRPPSATARIIA